MKEKTFSIGEAVSFGWGAMKKNFLFFLVFLLASFVIGSINNSIFTYEINVGEAEVKVRSILSIFISALLALAGTKVSLDAASGKTLNWENIKSSFPQYFHYLAANILTSLLVVAGLILLVVPGIIMALAFSMAPFLIVDKKMTAIKAIEESSRITKGHRLQLFGFCLVALLITIAGGLALGIGLFWAIPTTMIAFAYIYKKLK